MRAIRYSKSNILQYKNCPMSFYFKYFTPYGKIFRENNDVPIHLERGSICHEFFEEFNNRHDTTEIEKYLCKDEFYAKNINNFYGLLEQYNLDYPISAEEKFFNAAESFVGIIDAKYDLNDKSIAAIMENNELYPYLPQIKEMPDSTLAIIDYKTGKFNKNYIRKYEFELNLYVNLIEVLQPDTHIGWIGMFYTTFPQSSFIIPVNRKKLATDVKTIDKIKQKVIDKEFDRKHTALCMYCDFRHICDDYSDKCVSKAVDRLF